MEELDFKPIVLGNEEENKKQFNKKLDEMKAFKEKEGKDYILHKAEQLFEAAGNDPEKKSRATTEVCKLVLAYPDFTTQDFYIEELAKKHSGKRLFSTEIKKLREVSLKQDEDPNLKKPNRDEDFDTVSRYGFYIEDNKYMFSTKGGDGYKEGTNFIMDPLFHIYSRNDNKRLIKITNEFGYSKIVDVPSKVLPSPDQLQNFLYEEGNFLIFIQKSQFMKIINHISNNFPLCYELKTLGWQNEGFYAFANGIYDPKAAYQPVDDYGITKHDSKNYFSPAFSIINKDVRADDDEYENDRYFVYKKCDLDFSKWSALMQSVYGENGTIGVAYLIASLFRSFIYQTYKTFPHLFLFGEKGSGKSQMGWSLSNVFMAGNPPFNLNSGTDVAFFRRMSRFKDCAVFLDEYTNNLDEKRFQAMKSAYDGVGREKGKLTRDSRTEVDRVNAACCIAGQYLPTRDDNSLYTRSIVLTFVKMIFSQEAVNNFDTLKEFEKTSMSSLIVELLQYREVMEKEYTPCFQEIFSRLKRKASDEQRYFEERILRNYVTLLASLRVFEKYTPIDVGVNYDKFEKQCYQMSIEQSEKISESDALAAFWNMIVFLLETYQIQEGKDFNIKEGYQATILNKNGKTETIHLNEQYKPEKILYLRLEKIHPLYMKEHRAQHGEKGLELSSIKDYIKHHKAFVGIAKSHRFDNANTSAFVFRYSDVGVNLERDSSANNSQNNSLNNSEEIKQSNTPTHQQQSLNIN